MVPTVEDVFHADTNSTEDYLGEIQSMTILTAIQVSVCAYVCAWAFAVVLLLGYTVVSRCLGGGGAPTKLVVTSSVHEAAQLAYVLCPVRSCPS